MLNLIIDFIVQLFCAVVLLTFSIKYGWRAPRYSYLSYLTRILFLVGFSQLLVAIGIITDQIF